MFQTSNDFNRNDALSLLSKSYCFDMSELMS